MAGRRARLSVLLADKSALGWATRDTRARAAFLTLRSAHVIAEQDAAQQPLPR